MSAELFGTVGVATTKSAHGTIEDLDNRRRRVRASTLLAIETCAGTWLFDERRLRYTRVPAGAAEHPARSWRRYDRLLVSPHSDAFIVFLDSSGTRLLRSWRHRAPCPRCADANPRRSSEDLRRVARESGAP
jgi:hypothetical protein